MYCSTKSYTNLLASIVDMQQTDRLDKMQANQILNYAIKSNPDSKLNLILEHRIQHGLDGFDNDSVAVKHQIINDKVLVNLKRERTALNEVNNLVLETINSFKNNPDLTQLNDQSLTKTLQCIKNLNCERSVKIELSRSMKENVLQFVPEEKKLGVEIQIVNKQRELDKADTNNRKVVLQSTVENTFSP
ncbi:hypothetical protein [Acinetobacter sp. Marseille-Q1618]|uniref:hypothetical protein n=1 Tax=Acinetobacter sp. Marseille-Q1618 TaxID=2697502 RepID=UPI00157071A0|nr:hypothetical protein [Acinetobacter sp. Marseille-Q1618]